MYYLSHKNDIEHIHIDMDSLTLLQCTYYYRTQHIDTYSCSHLTITHMLLITDWLVIVIIIRIHSIGSILLTWHNDSLRFLPIITSHHLLVINRRMTMIIMCHSNKSLVLSVYFLFVLFCALFLSFLWSELILPLNLFIIVISAATLVVYQWCKGSLVTIHSIN
jgi:hypothetical protein